MLFREAEGHVGGPLLILGLVESQAILAMGALGQGLAEAHDHAVAEDPQDAAKEPRLLAVDLDVLILQEGEEGLSHRHSASLHLLPPPIPAGDQIGASFSVTHRCSGTKIGVT